MHQPTNTSAAAIVRTIRPTQWTKNLLLVAPLALAHKLTDGGRVAAVIFAIAAFSLCASGVYVLNDILDRKEDRLHPRKKFRPLAAGSLDVRRAVILMLVLIAGAFGLAQVAVGARFAGVLAIYLLLSVSYTMYFKQRLLVDVILLAALYTLRLIAGAVAARVPLSDWILVFSLFFFLSLAFVKRFAELTVLRTVSTSDDISAAGRNYTSGDLDILRSVGPSSGYIAILVFCLYINSDAVKPLYARPQVLWLICPILLYWITRIWFFATRGALVDDPVVFAVTDRVSWIAGIASGVILLLATMRGGWIFATS